MKSFEIEIKWAFIFILVGLFWMVLERIFGLHDIHIAKHAIYTNFVAIPAVAVYVYALLDKKKNYYKGKMSYRQGLVSGIFLSVGVTVLTPLSQLITSTLISPNYFNNVINYVVEKGQMTQEQAADYFNLKSYIIQGVFFAPVMGVLTSLIVAFAVKSKQA
ncbi:MAG: DUF4199 domain-containing protein [Bacteroidota bacterium]|jgi:hypothetical protein|nr:DUF4199 domain-containing protein [Bacteroidota bacterium]